MATPSEVAEYRRANAGVVALMERDLLAFWASLDLTKPERVRDALIEFLPVLVAQYGEIAATIAADWFDTLRADAVATGVVAASTAGVYRSRPADTVPAAAVVSQVRFGAQHLFTDQPEQTLVFLKGESQKYVLAPGRDTITQNAGRDKAARGWQRFVRIGGCKFCRMLSGLGGVYTEASSHFASHHHCNCVSAPTWDASAPRVDVAAEWVASQHTSSMNDDEREQFRRRVRNYLERQPDDRGVVHVDSE